MVSALVPALLNHPLPATLSAAPPRINARCFGRPIFHGMAEAQRRKRKENGLGFFAALVCDFVVYLGGSMGTSVNFSSDSALNLRKGVYWKIFSTSSAPPGLPGSGARYSLCSTLLGTMQPCGLIA